MMKKLKEIFSLILEKIIITIHIWKQSQYLVYFVDKDYNLNLSIRDKNKKIGCYTSKRISKEFLSAVSEYSKKLSDDCDINYNDLKW